jgi:hypothetical protein
MSPKLDMYISGMVNESRSVCGELRSSFRHPLIHTPWSYHLCSRTVYVLWCAFSRYSGTASFPCAQFMGQRLRNWPLAFSLHIVISMPYFTVIYFTSDFYCTGELRFQFLQTVGLFPFKSPPPMRTTLVKLIQLLNRDSGQHIPVGARARPRFVNLH